MMTDTATTAMSEAEVIAVLAGLKQATKSGDPLLEDGARVHVHYRAFRPANPRAVVEAQRAEELGLPRDRYTGRLSRVWRAKDGSLMVTVFVELERNRMWRAFNVTKGQVKRIVVLGN